MTVAEAYKQFPPTSNQTLMVRRGFGKGGVDIFEAVDNSKVAIYEKCDWEKCEKPAKAPRTAKKAKTSEV